MSSDKKENYTGKIAYSYIPLGFGLGGNKERLITDETT